jgi:hypothetical protein
MKKPTALPRYVFKPGLKIQFFASEQIACGAVLAWNAATFMLLIGFVRISWFANAPSAVATPARQLSAS